jgi:sarcosine oxidase
VIDAVGPLAGAFGTSGHGFKFAPLIGQLLADLACDLEPRFDLSRFSSGRPAVARG